MTSQPLPPATTPFRIVRKLIGALAVGVTFLGVLTFTVGVNRMETFAVESGLCQPGDCSPALGEHYRQYRAATGNPEMLYIWCLGSQELATISIDKGAAFLVPAIRIALQWPCGNVYG